MADTFTEKAHELAMRNDRAISELLTYARNLEPVLRDHNLNHSADRIAAILGEIEAVRAEAKDVLNSRFPELLKRRGL